MHVQALLRQVGFVKFDDCFIAFCPDRRVLHVDPPSYPASNCIPGLNETLNPLDATQGPLLHACHAEDILPALLRGDNPVLSLNATPWNPNGAEARAARAARTARAERMVNAAYASQGGGRVSVLAPTVLAPAEAAFAVKESAGVNQSAGLYMDSPAGLTALVLVVTVAVVVATRAVLSRRKMRVR